MTENKQAKQRKERGKVGKGSTQDPNFGMQKSNKRNAKQETKQNTAGINAHIDCIL